MSAADELLGLGLDIAGYAVGSHRLPCPSCAKSGKDEAFGLTVRSDGSKVWSCFRCKLKGASPGHHDRSTPVVQQRPFHQKKGMSPPADRDRLNVALDIWDVAKTITSGCDANSYLTARGCSIPPQDGHLRWLERHRHPSGWTGPCLVTLATDARTGEPRTIQCTWIDPAKPGQKAPIDKPRRLFRGLPKAGAVVRLFPDEDVLEGLAIGEGIETCLAAAHGFTPIWSTLDAGNMAGFPVLSGIQSLTIVADHDAAGLQASEQCARQWHAAGREVRRWCSPVPGEDAADFLEKAA
jgi:ribosomal protein L37AE/L43A